MRSILRPNWLARATDDPAKPVFSEQRAEKAKVLGAEANLLRRSVPKKFARTANFWTDTSYRKLIALTFAASLAAYAPTAEADSCLRGYRTKDHSQVMVVNRCRHQIYVSIVERNPITFEKQCAIFQLPQKDYGRAYPWEDYVVTEPAVSSLSERDAMTRCTFTGYPIVNDSHGNFVVIVRN